MLRKIIIQCLAPIRWAIRFELDRRRNIDCSDLEAELQLRARAETVEAFGDQLLQMDSVERHYDLLTLALGKVQIQNGLFLEFGVFSGKTINHIARQVNQAVYGFDSFEGLPERWRDRRGAGHCKVQSLPEVRDNVVLVKGWFDKTLPGFLEKNPGDASFVHIDCDLYSSTRTVFQLLAPRIKAGTVIVFDEYFNYPGWKEGEFKAFREFIADAGLSFEYLAYNSKGEQVAIRIVGRH